MGTRSILTHHKEEKGATRFKVYCGWSKDCLVLIRIMMATNDLNMKEEFAYTKSVTQQHIKSLGQYFTNPVIARFMCDWACRNAKTVLDPAVGNSIFLKYASDINPHCELRGYEIDKNILDFFGNPTSADICNSDYLLNSWDSQYDAIVCNPPYNRFQAVSNRVEILENIRIHTGIEYSSYTNLYVLFLIKSIFQMSDNGRLAYIIPNEFLNSKYGVAIKNLMIEKRLLKSIINFRNDKDLFFNATTTCCILLLDREENDEIRFYNLSSIDQLNAPATTVLEKEKYISVRYADIRPDEKWRRYLYHEKEASYSNLVNLSKFCTVSRGIATGANDFYCFNKSKIQENSISNIYFSKCICRSADIKSAIFTENDFDVLAKQDKAVYLLDVKDELTEELTAYIKHGESDGINEKYLPAGRSPWYSMEQKAPAPIWVCSACRDKIKFVRNLAGSKSLTTFHSIYIKDEYKKYTDLIFCYFLTPIAQTILRANRKELGNGLEKFQPNDLNSAFMVDITMITTEDYNKIMDVFHSLTASISDMKLEILNGIFLKYLSN